MPDGIFPITLSLTIISFIVGILLVLRGIIRYKDWSGGNKDEFWPFIALIVGGVDTILLGIVCLYTALTISFSLLDILLEPLLFISLIPIALFTIYYLRKLDKK